MKITKKFSFSAGHRLSDYDGPCNKLHGHNYDLEVTVSGALDKLGMVMDFGVLKGIVKEKVDKVFDHRLILKIGDPINENIRKLFPPEDTSICWVEYNPTAENMALDIFKRINKELNIKYRDINLERIIIYETATSYAEVDRSDF
jgi:6-pyruvoyltetrahydropterin/6-carboxytetrahydropterin synthase